VLLIHGKLLAERIQINLVTNPTIIIKDKNPGLLHEQGGLVAEKKICGEDGLALGQLPMRLLQIELDTEAIDELDDGVGVIAVLHDPHQILHEPAHLVLGSAGALDDATLAEEQGGSEVAQEMGGFGGDGLEVAFRLEELPHVLQSLGGVVPEDKEAPVEQPGALLQNEGW